MYIKGISIKYIKLPTDIIDQHTVNVEMRRQMRKSKYFKDNYNDDVERQMSKRKDKTIIEEKVFQDALTNERPLIGRGRGFGRGSGITYDIQQEEQLRQEGRGRAYGRGQRTATFDYEETEVKSEDERKPKAFGRGGRGRGIELQSDSQQIQENPVGGRGRAYGRGQQNQNDKSGLDVIDDLIFIRSKLNKISQKVANSKKGTMSRLGRFINSNQNKSQVKDQESVSSKLLGQDIEIFEDVDHSVDKENQLHNLEQSKDSIARLNSEIQEINSNGAMQ
ncbi:UNKNOWN [Stylonychia lemnae]|uniref:Uncharacterized protein n=1 Tax=Stylonychia lemnae TaxID=5949 RepID=A0A077ZT44_STYLE|nr:UNKNOWN [Stylonychia lemnae]|eukprot:CDW73057.1 UNKNOWN [Stylonychia lemnae]